MIRQSGEETDWWIQTWATLELEKRDMDTKKGSEFAAIAPFNKSFIAVEHVCPTLYFYNSIKQPGVI